MNNKIIDLEDYKIAIENKKNLDNNIETIDELSLEELECLNVLYKNEISELHKEVINLEEENIRIRSMLDK